MGKFEKNVSWQAPKRGAVVKESEVKLETSPSWPSSLPTSSWPSSLPARRAAAATKPAPQTARPPLPPPRSAPLPPPRARPPPPSPPTRRVVAPPASLQPGLNNTKELHPTSGAGAGELSGAGGRQTPARQFSYSFTSRMSRPPPPQVIHHLPHNDHHHYHEHDDHHNPYDHYYSSVPSARLFQRHHYQEQTAGGRLLILQGYPHNHPCINIIIA